MLGRDPGLRLGDIKDLTEARRETVITTVAWLVREGRLKREGAGRAGDPFRFFLAARTRGSRRKKNGTDDAQRVLTLIYRKFEEIGRLLRGHFGEPSVLPAREHFEPAQPYRQPPAYYYAPQPPPMPPPLPLASVPPPPSRGPATMAPAQPIPRAVQEQPYWPGYQQAPVYACMYCGRQATARFPSGHLVCDGHRERAAMESGEDATARRLLPRLS